MIFMDFPWIFRRRSFGRLNHKNGRDNQQHTRGLLQVLGSRIHGFTTSGYSWFHVWSDQGAHPRWWLWPGPSWTTKPTASSSTPAVQDLFWAIPQRSSYAKSDLDISMGPRTLQPKKWSMITYMITRNSVSVSVCMIHFHIFHDVIRQSFRLIPFSRCGWIHENPWTVDESVWIIYDHLQTSYPPLIRLEKSPFYDQEFPIRQKPFVGGSDGSPFVASGCFQNSQISWKFMKPNFGIKIR